MKSYLLLIFAALFQSMAHSEVSITGVGEVFSLNISTGQVAFVSYHSTDAGPDYPLLIANGKTNVFPLVFGNQSQPLAVLVGPIQLLKTNLGNRIISYQILTGSQIRSEIVTSDSTNVISVPNGKTIKFLNPQPLPSVEISVNVTFQNGGREITSSIYGGEEFTGPLSINIKYPMPQFNTNYVAIYPYFFKEDSVVMPELKLIQGPTGAFQIGVDKSIDLLNWYPVIIHNTSEEQKAFYRLSISR